MRRVASEVGAGVMSLYSYAPDKETLLELMVDQVSGELPTAGPPHRRLAYGDLKAMATSNAPSCSGIRGSPPR